VLAKIAALNPFVNVLFVERDENLAVMDQYLTNGVRSIPKLVVFNEEGEELFIWGSRPAAAQALVLAQKGLGVPMSEWEEKLHLWYAKDRGKNLENEICEALEGQFTSSRL
jgi:hypothetical protein